MRKKIIHHLDEDCNIVFTEKQYLSKGFIFKIEIEDLGGDRKVFENKIKNFNNKKDIKAENYGFRKEVKAQVKKERVKNRDMALKIIKSIANELQKRPVVSESVVDVLLNTHNNLIKPSN